jgi:thioredoxin 1
MNTTRVHAIPALIIALLIAVGCKPDTAIDNSSARGAGSGLIMLTDANFERLALNGTRPVLVYFWATSCVVCQELKPAVQELAVEHLGQVKVAELDVKAHRITAKKYGVHKVPTLLLFRGGKVVERHEGRATKEALDQLLTSVREP